MGRLLEGKENYPVVVVGPLEVAPEQFHRLRTVGQGTERSNFLSLGGHEGAKVTG